MNYEKLNRLIDTYIEYININTEDERHCIDDRVRRKQFFQSYDYVSIINMSDEELKNYLNTFWSVMSISINSIITKNTNFKYSLAQLLYGEGDIEQRCVNFHNNISVFKISAMSELLAHVYPEQFMIWNSKVRTVFRMIGVPEAPKDYEEFDVSDYMKMLSYGKIIRNELSRRLGKQIDLLDADYFYEVIMTRIINFKELDRIVNSYKQDIDKNIKEEIYKWDAVKCFQEHWNIDAPDFKTMFELSFEKRDNLLTSFHYYPYGMITAFLSYEPLVVKDMFNILYDETKNLKERINYFISKSDELLIKYWESGKHHYQDTHTISVYLSLRYPDKYYIYKASVMEPILEKLVKDYNKIRSESQAEKIYETLNYYFNKCALINDYVTSDSNLIKKYNRYVNYNQYTYDNYHMLIQDILYYTSKENKHYWTYSPGENGIHWDYCKTNNKMVIGFDKLGDLNLIENKEQLIEVVKDTYNKENPYNDIACVDDFYNKLKDGDIVIAKIGMSKLLGYGRVIDNEYYFDETRAEYKHCRNVEWIKQGYWNVPNDLKVAQKTLTDITEYDDFAEKLLNIMEGDSVQMVEKCNYYCLVSNPKIYSFTKLGINETIEYTSINENGNKRRIYNNFEQAKIGDKVLAYESTPTKQFIGLYIIEQVLENKNIVFKKVKQFSNPIPYSVLSENKLLSNSEPFQNGMQGSLFKLTSEEYDIICEIINEYNPVATTPSPKYKDDDFKRDVYIDDKKYEEIVKVLKIKKNIILQGAPGVGKTYMAKKLAYSLIGVEDENRVKLIQFHQNYSYEDFIEGIRPNEEGKFVLEKGMFYNFCKRAENDPNNDYYLIIDEINRGNLSKIFGELLMLIENDKRGEESLTLTYSKTPFTVPKNLYIIGMMNTADRSLAIMDYALRRRFSFIDIEPAFNNDKFKQYISSLNDNYLNEVIGKIIDLNKIIEDDPSLGSGFKIGHSYFCNLDKSDLDIKNIIKFEIIPMLKEYWFDEEDKVKEWTKKLLGD